MMMSVDPGRQVVVVPMWAVRIIKELADLPNFTKVRQVFTQEQIVALEAFSHIGLDIFYHKEPLPSKNSPHTAREAGRSLGYLWFFPEEARNTANLTEADRQAMIQSAHLSDNHVYADQMVKDHVYEFFKRPANQQLNIHQSYSVYSVSEGLIVLALDQGILSPSIYTRREELRLEILRKVIQELRNYYEPHVVHQTSWFDLYLRELNTISLKQ